MAKHYCAKKDVEALLGYEITDDGVSRPNLKQLENQMGLADDLINGQLRNYNKLITGNISDETGFLRVLAADLVSKIINNMFAFSNPDAYTLIPLEFTPEQLKMLHKASDTWDGITFEIGE